MVGVIILNYNSSHDCIKCVSFLKKQVDVDLEIIIVDNPSREEDYSRIKAFCKDENITFLESSENRGFSAGNNVGLRYSSRKGYEYALILNPDMELTDSRYISAMLERVSSDENIAVLGTDIVNAGGRHQNPLREPTFFEEFFWPLDCLRGRFSSGLPFVLTGAESGFCEKLSGCCFMVRLEFIESIGYLDENTFLYSEEPILAKQVQSAGKKLYYLNAVSATHMHISVEKGNSNQRMLAFIKSRIYYVRRYSGRSSASIHLLCFSKFILKMWIYFKLWKNKTR